MDPIVEKLKGTDRRSIGRVDEVVAEVIATPLLFEVLFEGILHDDPIISMRCADAVEKVTARYPEYLQPYKMKLIQQVARLEQKEVRWHVAQLFPRLEAAPAEQAVMVAILRGYLDDESKIVKTHAMEALADFALRDPALLPDVVELLERLTATGSPAVQKRGHKLLRRFQE